MAIWLENSAGAAWWKTAPDCGSIRERP